MKEMLCKTWQPGDEDKQSFRFEIYRQDGQPPTPRDAIFMGITVLADIAEKTGLAKDGKAFIRAVLETGYKIEEVPHN